jgi:hypothetical protein
MIWHIFKKDWRLLWRMVAGVALAHAMLRTLMARALADARLAQLSGMLALVAIFCTGILIVMVVHQDAIPGLRQDWLVRPIRRSDLLWSKLLFVALLVQGPILVTEISVGLIAGLPPGQSIGVALSHSVWMLLALNLPCLALGTLTRNLAEAIGASLAVFLGFFLFSAYIVEAPPTLWTGVFWVTESAQVAWGLVAVAIILVLQYRRRKTTLARWTFGAATFVWIFVQFLPWRTAFAIEERLSRQPEVANSIRIAFEQDLVRVPGLSGSSLATHSFGNRREREVSLSIPMRIDGLSKDSILMAEKVTLHLTEPGGKAIELGHWGVGESGRLAGGSFHQRTEISEESYDQIKDQRLRLEIDYSLTLLKANPAQTMPAVGGDRWIPDLGRCTSGADPAGTQVELHCVAPGKLPCLEWSLENARNRAPAPGNQCRPDYAPYVARIIGGPSSRFDASFQFEGAPDELQRRGAQLIFLVHLPAAHFTRRVVIPGIKLSDWGTE